MQNWRLDDILSSQSNNMRLVEGLKLLKQRATLGSLASSDDLEFAQLCQFRQISRLEIEDTITGIEPFPGEMMSPKRMNVTYRTIYTTFLWNTIITLMIPNL